MYKVKTKIPNRYNEPSSFMDVIYDMPTNSHSRSSLLMLNDHYRGLEVEYYRVKLNIDLSEFTDAKPFISKLALLEILRQAFNRNFLEKSKLNCEYCSKLVKIYGDTKLSRQHDCATVDHKVPLIDGCHWFDETNMAVCCYECNNVKGNIAYDDWIKMVNEKKEIKLSRLRRIEDYQKLNFGLIINRINELQDVESLQVIFNESSTIRNDIYTQLISEDNLEAEKLKENYLEATKIMLKSDFKMRLIISPLSLNKTFEQLYKEALGNKKWQKILLKYPKILNCK